MGDFSVNIEKIRSDAERDLKEGALTKDYKADKAAVLKMLDQALATEWLCVMRYTQNAQSVQGIYGKTVADEFCEHANEEQQHAKWLAERIKQLGGKINLNPETFASRSQTEYTEGENLSEMIKENLIAERIAIEIYGQMIRAIGNDDPTTRRLFEKILEQEEEHADDLADLMGSFDPRDQSTSISDGSTDIDIH